MFKILINSPIRGPPMIQSDTPLTPHTNKTPRPKIRQILRLKAGKQRRYECYDYIHPEFGVLTIVLDHELREFAAISFTPTRNVVYKLVPSVDWYFNKGKSTGTGIGQTGWEGWCKNQKFGK